MKNVIKELNVGDVVYTTCCLYISKVKIVRVEKYNNKVLYYVGALIIDDEVLEEQEIIISSIDYCFVDFDSAVDSKIIQCNNIKNYYLSIKNNRKGGI